MTNAARFREVADGLGFIVNHGRIQCRWHRHHNWSLSDFAGPGGFPDLSIHWLVFHTEWCRG